MALHRPTLGQKMAPYQDLLRALVVVAAVIAAMLVATAVFGVRLTGPSYEIVPDPAGLTLPF